MFDSFSLSQAAQLVRQLYRFIFPQLMAIVLVVAYLEVMDPFIYVYQHGNMQVHQ
jgi:hypothetical protein